MNIELFEIDGGYQYVDNGDETASITNYAGKGNCELEGQMVTTIGEKAFFNYNL